MLKCYKLNPSIFLCLIKIFSINYQFKRNYLTYENFKKINFLLLGKDIKLLNDYTNDKFSLKKIKVNNSNIFFKGKENETISIIKIFKASLFLDDEKLLNLFKLNGEVFNIFT
jgi:hypothetical protein